MKHTHIFTIIDEETMETLKVVDNPLKSEPKMVVAKFHTIEEANEVASETLNLWTVIEHEFWHPHIKHEPNTFTL